ncbi:hypothetical protein [Microbacterium sp. 22242]|uniref:hypothetical protein n=1 Tax=Microbacterium sp. 22242 TaxID=3453896 RepID=UPI003F85E812
MSRGALIPVAAAAALSIALAGCTSSPAPKPSPTASGSSTLSAADVAAKIAAAKPSTASIAHVTGTLATSGVGVRIDVEQVRALADSTMIVWRLSTASGTKQDVSTFQFAVAPDTDGRNIALSVGGGATTVRPYTFRYQNRTGQGSSCLCGDIGPDTDGTGQQLYALMPPLPAGTKTVDVSMPGFDVMKDVPVSR